MERKEIFAVIAAAAVIIFVIGVLSMMRGSGSTESSEGFSAVVSEIVPDNTEKTDVWDVIREQQQAMSTTTETEAVITDEINPEETLPEDESEFNTVIIDQEVDPDTEQPEGEQPADEEQQMPEEPLQTAIQIVIN